MQHSGQMDQIMSPPPSAPSGLAGLRVLVVEDEAAIALLLEDMLLDLGCEVLGPVGRLPDALKLAEADAIDVAILDVNLAGVAIYPVADALRLRGVPFLFSTGYGAGGIDAAFRDSPVLQKPFSQDDLEAKLLQTAASA